MAGLGLTGRGSQGKAGMAGSKEGGECWDKVRHVRARRRQARCGRARPGEARSGRRGAAGVGLSRSAWARCGKAGAVCWGWPD